MSDNHPSEHLPQKPGNDPEAASGTPENLTPHDGGPSENSPRPIMEKVATEAKKLTRNLTENLESASPSKRFLLMFVGIFGFILILTSIWFGLHALLTPSSSLPSTGIDLVKMFPEFDMTLAAGNKKINDELILMINDNSAPAQLMAKEIPAEKDLAHQLYNEFHTIHWESHLSEMRLYIARTPWHVSFLEIKNMLSLLEQCDEKRKKIRVLLNSHGADMQPTYTVDQYGFTMEQKNRDLLWAYIHLEEYEIARALTGMTFKQIREMQAAPETIKPNMAQAVEALCSIFKATEIASRQKDLNLRLDASYIRENALDTLQVLVSYPEFTLHEAAKVLNVLENQLIAWPSDGQAFEGERVAGIWLYEMVRRKRLIDAIAREDVAALQKLGPILSVEQLIFRNVDNDELFYLKRMSEIIFLCQEPYFKRLERLNSWEIELETQRGELSEYPALAGAILLRDVRLIMHRLTLDRVRTEAWALALASSLGQATKQVGVHPMTGEPYRVQVTATPYAEHKNAISLTWRETESPVSIPVYCP